MLNTEQMTDRLVELLARLIRQHPRLVFPDERVKNLKEQLKSLRASSADHPEDRMFLFRILAVLRSREEPPTMGELSAELGIPLSTATRMADHLVRGKIVERRDDPTDRRIVRLCLTANGRKFIEMGASFLKQRVNQVLSRFTPEEQAQLLKLVGKLIDSLEA
ncbi:MAG TPA: MarR family transcriptional regulator, partial [Anaerolineales bacterium]|nr:MarR family transcriptional regulator [Anaerolineales bacterium]